jgi:putative phage-type endonuclease
MNATLFSENCTALVPDSDRPAWLLARRSHITATDVAGILGLSPWSDAMSVYADKVIEAPPETGDPAEHLLWGRILEAPIAEEFARRSGRQLINGGVLLESRSVPILAATLDREQIDPTRPDPGIYEGKTVTAWLSRDWKADEPPPDHVMIQVQSQMLVTGASWATVFALIGGNKPVTIEVEVNREIQDVILEACSEFWRMVEERIPPEPTVRSREALEALYPKEKGNRIMLPPETVGFTARLHELREARKAIEAEEDTLKNHLRALLGQSAYGVLPQDVGKKGMWKWVTETKPAYSVAAKSSRVLREVKVDKAGLLAREDASRIQELDGWTPAPQLAGGEAPEVEAEPVEVPPPAMKRTRSRRR